jgi:hypothetical protein
MYVPFSVFCVLFVCKCVLYCCHRVSTQCVLYCCHRVSTQLRLKVNKTNKHTNTEKKLKNCDTVLCNTGYHKIYSFYTETISFPAWWGCIFISHFQATLLRVLDTRLVCCCSRDINTMNCPLIHTVSYLIVTPAPDMRTCWAAACWRRMVTCFLTQVRVSQYWLRPVITTNWFFFSEADDVSCFVGQNVETVQVLTWLVPCCQRFSSFSWFFNSVNRVGLLLTSSSFNHRMLHVMITSMRRVIVF